MARLLQMPAMLPGLNMTTTMKQPVPGSGLGATQHIACDDEEHA
jgi:hypothetical protein